MRSVLDAAGEGPVWKRRGARAGTPRAARGGGGGMRALIGQLFAGPVFGGRPRTGYSDIVLASAAVLIIRVMLLPLLLVVIDALVAVNDSMGFGLLLLAISIPTPLAFSSFPSVLLLTAL